MEVALDENHLIAVFPVQVASRALGIPASKIHITETSTNTVPNTSPTAASVSSDLNGMAVYVRQRQSTNLLIQGYLCQKVHPEPEPEKRQKKITAKVLYVI